MNGVMVDGVDGVDKVDDHAGVRGGILPRQAAAIQMLHSFVAHAYFSFAPGGVFSFKKRVSRAYRWRVVFLPSEMPWLRLG